MTVYYGEQTIPIPTAVVPGSGQDVRRGESETGKQGRKTVGGQSRCKKAITFATKPHNSTILCRHHRPRMYANCVCCSPRLRKNSRVCTGAFSQQFWSTG